MPGTREILLKVAKVVLIAPPFLLLATLGVYVFSSIFTDTNVDTYKTLTNYGVAIVYGMSSLCFAWSRSITDDSLLQKFAHKMGETFLLSSIGFLIQSAIKYVYVYIKNEFNSDRAFEKDIPLDSAIRFVLAVTFLITFCLFFYSLLMTTMNLTRTNKSRIIKLWGD